MSNAPARFDVGANDRADARADHCVCVLAGCTAAGKSDVAVELAGLLGAEIVSIDSMQVYKRMDIGTAKPTADMLTRARHHLIDIVQPSEGFTAARFREAADAAIADIRARGALPLLVAGTPLYLVGLLYGMFEGPSADPEFRAGIRERAEREGTAVLHSELATIDPVASRRIHPNDLKRIERALEVHHATGRTISDMQQQWHGPPRHAYRAVGLRRPKDELNQRINARVRAMIDAGLVDEVRRLLAESAGLSQAARQALGYAEIIAHCEGRGSLPEAVERIKIHTRRFAKSQRTWFRRLPGIQWLDVGPDEAAATTARRAADALGR